MYYFKLNIKLFFAEVHLNSCSDWVHNQKSHARNNKHWCTWAVSVTVAFIWVYTSRNLEFVNIVVWQVKWQVAVCNGMRYFVFECSWIEWSVNVTINWKYNQRIYRHSYILRFVYIWIGFALNNNIFCETLERKVERMFSNYISCKYVIIIIVK